MLLEKKIAIAIRRGDFFLIECTEREVIMRLFLVFTLQRSTGSIKHLAIIDTRVGKVTTGKRPKQEAETPNWMKRSERATKANVHQPRNELLKLEAGSTRNYGAWSTFMCNWNCFRVIACARAPVCACARPRVCVSAVACAFTWVSVQPALLALLHSLSTPLPIQWASCNWVSNQHEYRWPRFISRERFGQAFEKLFHFSPSAFSACLSLFCCFSFLLFAMADLPRKLRKGKFFINEYLMVSLRIPAEIIASPCF